MNLNTNIDFDLNRFFLWWGHELAFLVPEKIRKALSDKSGYVYLSISADSLQFNRIVAGNKQGIAELSFTGNDEEQQKQLTGILSKLEKEHFVLRLKSDQAIKKILYLPAAAKENLHQVVAYEMDRYTPFTADQVYYAIQLLEKKENGQIKVLLICTPKRILDPLFQQLNALDIHPVVVDCEEVSNNVSDKRNCYNLLPEWKKPVRDRFTRGLIAGLSLMLLLLTLAVVILPVWHEKRTVESLREQVKALEKETRIVQAQQLEIDAVIEETLTLINIKNNAPLVIQLINILSRLMPDETWLTHLKYSKAKLQIQGQSPAASALIGILEGSAMFSNARFVSPLTQDKKTGKERFQISVDVNVKREGDAF